MIAICEEIAHVRITKNIYIANGNMYAVRLGKYVKSLWYV